MAQGSPCLFRHWSIVSSWWVCSKSEFYIRSLLHQMKNWACTFRFMALNYIMLSVQNSSALIFMVIAVVQPTVTRLASVDECLNRLSKPNHLACHNGARRWDLERGLRQKRFLFTRRLHTINTTHKVKDIINDHRYIHNSREWSGVTNCKEGRHQLQGRASQIARNGVTNCINDAIAGCTFYDFRRKHITI
jgi:hypothetical protein